MNNWTLKDFQDKKIAQVNGTYQVLKPIKEVKPNAKIKNAVKSVNGEGVKFDSNLERTMYDLLVGAGVSFEFQYEYVIQPRFKYGGGIIRPIKLRTDFWLPERNTIIDTKGHATAISKLKYKLLKYYFFNKGDGPKIYMPGTPKECQFLVNKLLYDKI